MAMKEYKLDDGHYGVRTFQWDIDDAPLPPGAKLVGEAPSQESTGFRRDDQVDQDEPPKLGDDPNDKKAAKRPANKAVTARSNK